MKITDLFTKKVLSHTHVCNEQAIYNIDISPNSNYRIYLKYYYEHTPNITPNRLHAKCGKRSIAYCRRYGSIECVSCDLVKRKPKNRVIVNGIERKLCTHCGKLLPLHRFYDRTIYRNDRTYHLKTSWCRLCMSNTQYERNNRKSTGTDLHLNTKQ